MARKPRLTKKAVEESILHYNGNISAVARAFSVKRRSVYTFLNDKYPELWEVVNEARESWKDDAESELMRQAIDQGNTTALIFFLKTQAKDRGWVERQEISGPDGAPMEINMKWEEDGPDA